MNVASDMTDGTSFQDSAKSRLNEGMKTFAMSNLIISQSGSTVRRKHNLQSSRRQYKKIKEED